MKLDLDEIEKRLKAATPGKWIAVPNNVWETMYRVDGITHIEGIKKNDAYFIAHSRQDIESLLAFAKDAMENLKLISIMDSPMGYAGCPGLARAVLSRWGEK